MAGVLLALVCGVLVSEIAIRIPWFIQVAIIRGNLDKAWRLLRSPIVSDHFKERLVPVYSFRSMGASLRLLGLFGLVGLPLLAAYGALALGLWSVDVFTLPGLVAMAVASIVYFVARTRFGRRNKPHDGVAAGNYNYSPLDKTVHRLALSTLATREMAFDLEKGLFLGKTAPPPTRNVFVCGVARSGTTALLNALSRNDNLASLTYQDMPFVLAPNLWSRIARPKRNSALRERAHGDGILINAQSPESFEEVFWSLFEETSTRAMSVLRPHRIDAEAQAEFESYMRLVCLRCGKGRYLSKNNTNIYRLEALAAAMPESRFLVPFRRPEHQAASLMQQHLRFIGSAAFEANYMGWIGHYEFGATLKPVAFDEYTTNGLDPSQADYWLDVWTRTYTYLHALVAGYANIRLVCYEQMAATEPDYVERLADFCGAALDPADFRPALRSDADGFDRTLMAEANALYDRMRAASASATDPG